MGYPAGSFRTFAGTWSCSCAPGSSGAVARARRTPVRVSAKWGSSEVARVPIGPNDGEGTGVIAEGDASAADAEACAVADVARVWLAPDAHAAETVTAATAMSAPYRLTKAPIVSDTTVRAGAPMRPMHSFS